MDGQAEKVIEYINRQTAEAGQRGEKAGVIATEETKKAYCAPVVLAMGERSDEEGIARHLFDILRRFDETDVDVIYSESFETPNLGQAIMNRLLKAAGHRMIKV